MDGLQERQDSEKSTISNGVGRHGWSDDERRGHRHSRGMMTGMTYAGFVRPVAGALTRAPRAGPGSAVVTR